MERRNDAHESIPREEVVRLLSERAMAITGNRSIRELDRTQIAQLRIIDDLAWELLGVALGDIIQPSPNPTDDEQLFLWSRDG